MDPAMVRVRIDELFRKGDLQALRDLAVLLTKCIPSSSNRGGYNVRDSGAPQYEIYSGSREECVAYATGYEDAPCTDVGVFDPVRMCVCVAGREALVVWPEERFGECLLSASQRPESP